MENVQYFTKIILQDGFFYTVKNAEAGKLQKNQKME